MRELCAWCSKIIKEGPAWPILTTHGICSECDAKFRKEIDMPPKETKPDEKP